MHIQEQRTIRYKGGGIQYFKTTAQIRRILGKLSHLRYKFDTPWLAVKKTIHITVTDMEGNIRKYRLPKGRGPYHDPRAVCLS